MSTPPPMDNSSAIADSKIPPGEDYEEIREQVSDQPIDNGFSMIAFIIGKMNTNN
jgi:hypothetical protein